jgi:hypothetical protein
MAEQWRIDQGYLVGCATGTLVTLEREGDEIRLFRSPVGLVLRLKATSTRQESSGDRLRLINPDESVDITLSRVEVPDDWVAVPYDRVESVAPAPAPPKAPPSARAIRLRRIGGLTLLVVTVWAAALGLYDIISAQPDDYGNLYPVIGVALLLFVALPTGLATVGVLREGRTGAVAAGIFSLIYGAGGAWVFFMALTGGYNNPDPPSMGQFLGAAGWVLAYGFAGIAALLTIHARDDVA